MKTINEIITEMRTLTMPGETVEHTYELLHSFARDIEIAVRALVADRDNWRRQALEEDARANEVQSVTNCNQFKIRESLEVAHRTLKLVYENAVEFIQPHLADEIIHVGSAIEAALSTPARNCDLYATELERRTAFIDWYNETFNLKGSKDEIDTCDLKHDVDGILHEYIQWLFAEAKGGAE